MPGRLEDVPWVPLPGPCCCDGRWSDQRSYAYGPNGDGSIEGPDMAVLLGVIQEGKVSAARRKYFPDCQTPAPPAVVSAMLPDQQAQLLGDVQRQNFSDNLMNPAVAASQMPIEQQVYAPGGARQNLTGSNPASGGVMAPPHQPGQTPARGVRQQGQAPVPWPSTLVGQIGRPQNHRQGLSYSRTDQIGRPMPVSLPQQTVTSNDAMAWYNSNIFPPIDAPAASLRPRQGHPPPRQRLPQPRQQPAPVRQQPATGRKRPRLHSPFQAAGPNVPLSQQQPHPQPRGYDPFPAQNYFDLINETEQRNMRPGTSTQAAPRPSTSTAGPSTFTAGPSTSTAGPSTFVPDPLTPAFVPQTSVDVEGTNVARTASEQPATSGDWTRNLGHYVQPQFRNQGTGTPYIQPQWKRQPGAWTRGE